MLFIMTLALEIFCHLLSICFAFFVVVIVVTVIH